MPPLRHSTPFISRPDGEQVLSENSCGLIRSTSHFFVYKQSNFYIQKNPDMKTGSCSDLGAVVDLQGRRRDELLIPDTWSSTRGCSSLSGHAPPTSAPGGLALAAQLTRGQGGESYTTSFSEPEEGVIPDSPKQPLSFPVVNKMKRKRDQSNIRYAEKRPSPPLPARGVSDPPLEAALVTTVDLLSRSISRRNLEKLSIGIFADSHIRYAEKRPSPPLPESNTKRHGRTVVPESCRLDLNSQQMSESDDEDEGKEKARNFTSSCPEAEEQNAEKNRDRPESSQRPPKHPEQPIIIQAETVDLDCTYVSHSLLVAHQRQTQLKQTNCTTGIGQKANDSLAHIFDTTGHEEYESCPQSCLMGEENEEEEECEEQDMGRGDEVTEEAKCLDEVHPDGDAGESARDRSVAHVVVVRKKAERRKLHGHTCKECEIYYADLPEDERRKKLSSCSRHRYRYIPPSTPENFWDVGFPSTQTCVERGYIKEDNQVDPRSRRRRPYHAMFSPKAL
ncbi:DNA endonuclease RBBP8 [Silurus meridionalis]|nr:DNA endonuclease RBBP8 [Silurus meridionalis]